MATGQDAELAFEGGVDVTLDAKDGRQQTILIRPSQGWVPLNLNDLWRYRELTYFLTWRDLKVRYRQTLIGATWGLLQPFLMMVVFSASSLRAWRAYPRTAYRTPSSCTPRSFPGPSSATPSISRATA